jgi:hypothetical protein
LIKLYEEEYYKIFGKDVIVYRHYISWYNNNRKRVFEIEKIENSEISCKGWIGYIDIRMFKKKYNLSNKIKCLKEIKK